MRWFDTIGIVAVGAWIALTAGYVYRHETGSSAAAAPMREEVPLTDGEDWLMLRRDGGDIGFVHRTRTRLEDGWLVEYELLVVLEIFENEIPVETSIRAELDESARLREFDAELQGPGKNYTARGTVRGPKLALFVDTGSGLRRRELELEEPPRLASNAIHQVLARDDLESGETFESRFFDPTAMRLRTIRLEYRGREKFEPHGDEARVHRIRQTLRGSSYDVLVDDEGHVVRQEFPMGIAGVDVAKARGEQLADELQDRAERARQSFTAGSEIDRGIRSALELLGFRALPDDAGASGAAPDAGTEPEDNP